MSQILFDAYSINETLKNAGFQEQQAKALVQSFEIAFHGGVATKNDINELKQEIADVKGELKKEIADVKAELKHEMMELRHDLLNTEARLEKTILELRNETKQDKAELKHDIEKIRTDMEKNRAEMSQMISAMTFKIIGILSGVVAVIAALSKMFH